MFTIMPKINLEKQVSTFLKAYTTYTVPNLYTITLLE